MKATNSKEIGFKVIGITKAVKEGHIVVKVEFDSNPNKTYTYVRDTSDGRNYCYIDGCRVEFHVDGADWYYVDSIERKYATAGKKKLNGKANTKKSVSEAIKGEMEQKGIHVEIEVAGTTDEAEVEYKATPIPPKAENQDNGPVVHEKYEQIKTCIDSGIPVYLAGPAGSGKNHTVEQVANELDMDFYFSNSIQHEYKLTGFIDAGGKYHETEFYKACTNDKDCVFFLDEIDASIPDVLVLLNAAIANGYFEFPNGRVDFDHVHFVAAGNTVGNGADDLYTGRMVIDQATLDRFAIIEFDYSLRIEMHITKGNRELVDFIHTMRKEAEMKGIRSTFSYRCMTMVRKLEAAGMDLVTVLKIAVVKGLDRDTINTFNPNGNSKYHVAFNEVKRSGMAA